MKSGDIKKAICREWMLYWIPECRVGCGWGEDGDRTMDLWGISTTRPYEHVAVEIKVSRGDFLRDLKQPLKQRRARLAANQFYFAAPAGLLTAADLPMWSGLVEVSEEGRMDVVVVAPWFDSSPPTWSFVASMVRRFHHRDIPGDVLAVCAAALDAAQSDDPVAAGAAIRRARVAIAAVQRTKGTAT